MSTFARLCAASAVAVATALPAAAATVLQVDLTYPAVSPIKGALTCDDSCLGLVDDSPATWAGDGAVLFAVSPPNPANEKAFVDAVAGYDVGAGTKTDPIVGDPENYDFVTNALFVLFKIGNKDGAAEFLIKNTYGAGLKISWDAADGEGAGFSHYTEYGQAPPPVVPLPAAGFLLAGAVAGMGLFRRRRRA